MATQGISENHLLEKSFLFAKRCVKLHLFLSKDKRLIDLSRQLLRSGTSIGANIHEASVSQSKKDFLCKMSIAKKEASETVYWISLLLTSDLLPKKAGESLLQQAKELLKLLVATCKTTTIYLKSKQ